MKKKKYNSEIIRVLTGVTSGSPKGAGFANACTVLTSHKTKLNSFVRQSRKIGFTLAEVLITLGIIGVVAAMTIPTLINNAKEKETVTKLKKMNTILNQAFNMAVNEYGTPDLWDFTASSIVGSDPDLIAQDLQGRDNVMKKFEPFLKKTYTCYYTDNTCSNNPKYIRERYSLDGTSFGSWTSPRFILADGSSIDIFYMSSPTCSVNSGSTPQLKNICGEIFVDLNGIKPPNITGKDVFWFRISKYGIIPGGLEGDTIRSFDDYCNISKNSAVNGYGCAAWVIYNENMDYLKCSDLSWQGKKRCK